MSTLEPATANSRRPIEVVARALGLTRGQVGTAIVALLVASTLTLGGLPPVLRQRGAKIGPASATTTASAGTAPTGKPSSPDLASPVLAPVPATPFNSGAGSSTSSFTSSADNPAVTGASPAPSGPAAPPVGTAAVFAPVGAPGAPDGIAVGADGTVYVATNNGSTQGETGASRILTFSRMGTPGHSLIVSGQPAGHALGLTGLALDNHGGLLALDAATGRVLRFDLASGRQSTYAELLDLPACQLVVAAVNGCEPGVRDDKPLPRGLAFDAAGALYVTDSAQGMIWQIPAGGGQSAVFLDDVAFGSGDGLAGIALTPDGTIVVSSPQAVDPAAGGGGAVYRVAVTGGKAGAKTLVARFKPGESPAGLALLDDGSMVVTLRAANAIVLLDATGTEVRRVTGTAGATAIDAPAGVAFHGSTLLVTNQSPTNKAGWAVLTVGIR